MNTENDPPKLIEGSLYNEVPMPPRNGKEEDLVTTEAAGATGAAEPRASRESPEVESVEGDREAADRGAEHPTAQTEIAAGSTTAGASGIGAADVDNVGFGAAGLAAGAAGAAGSSALSRRFGTEGAEDTEGAEGSGELPKGDEELTESPAGETEEAMGESSASAVLGEDNAEEERKKKRRRTLLALLGLLLLILLVFLGCRSVFGAGDSSGDSELTSMDLQPVSTEGIVNRIAVSATVEPESQQVISAPGAAKVEKLDVAVGDRVEKDQVLASLNADDLKEQLAEAERHADAVRKEGDEAVAAAEKEYERLKAEAARGNATIVYDGKEYTLDQARSNPEIEPEALQQALAEANVVDTGVTQKDVDTQSKVVRDTRKSAEDADKEAEKAVEKLRKQIDDASVKAPMDGVITEVRVKEGQNAEGTMMVVADDSAFKMRGEVKETDIDKVTEGSQVTFTTPATGDKEFTGEVVSVSPVAGGTAPQEDSSSAMGSSSSAGSGAKVTFPVEIAVTGDTEGLRMGASARAKILQEIAKDTMAVPAESVYSSESGSEAVLVVTRDSRVVERGVETGETDGYLVAVNGSDLKSSDRVILQPYMYQDLEGKKVDVSDGLPS
ncbi:efflux RND transporter periplasmic adaptor subunit [Corynebacterium mastitidis]|uniref:efflux RND transporter periplasmic adaptor subunit n=1 Tax=Corynebacterium mastitidis TaxID=161890 RepID=UPI0030E8B9B0